MSILSLARRLGDDFEQEDQSFKESSPLEFIFPKQWTRQDMKNTWVNGVRHGIEMGLSEGQRVFSPAGYRIDIINDQTSEEDKEFAKKIFKLMDDHGVHFRISQFGGLEMVKNEPIF